MKEYILLCTEHTQPNDKFVSVWSGFNFVTRRDDVRILKVMADYWLTKHTKAIQNGHVWRHHTDGSLEKLEKR